ncbi:MAG TPA: hypothetical protein VHO95_00445 [Candidatus Dormibacteraeota bacterium]|nr:hypothetical protein [Candidatus Dormibacteraeota bacterium]
MEEMVTWRKRIDGLSQRTRRVVAVASLLGLPGMYGWYSIWHNTRVPGVLWGPVSFALILVTAVGAFLLYAFVGDRANRNSRLDERQRQLRDRAWILSYEVLAAVIVAAMGVVGVLVLVMGKVVTLDGTAVGELALSVGVLLPLLPIAALAWVEPDAPAEA